MAGRIMIGATRPVEVVSGSFHRIRSLGDVFSLGPLSLSRSLSLQL